MQTTIRHHSTRRSICAYLALHDFALKSARITAYMHLMHAVRPGTTREMLSHLQGEGAIRRVKRGMYERG